MNDRDTLVDRIEAALVQFIRERFDVSDGDDDFGTDINLWEEGYVDSIGLVEVIAFIESTYDVKVEEHMLFDPDFTSISGMSRLLAGRISS